MLPDWGPISGGAYTWRGLFWEFTVSPLFHCKHYPVPSVSPAPSLWSSEIHHFNITLLTIFSEFYKPLCCRYGLFVEIKFAY